MAAHQFALTVIDGDPQAFADAIGRHLDERQWIATPTIADRHIELMVDARGADPSFATPRIRAAIEQAATDSGVRFHWG